MIRQMPTVTSHAMRASRDMTRALLSRTPMTALTPALALDFINALSRRYRAAVVLDAAGAHLAGPRALADAARALPDGRTGGRGR